MDQKVDNSNISRDMCSLHSRPYCALIAVTYSGKAKRQPYITRVIQKTVGMQTRMLNEKKKTCRKWYFVSCIFLSLWLCEIWKNVKRTRVIYFLVCLHEESATFASRFMNRKNYSLICKLLDDGDFYDDLISIKRKLDMDVKTWTTSGTFV